MHQEKVKLSKKQNSPKGYRWCKTNDGIKCDGNIYSVQVMQKSLSSGPKTFLQALNQNRIPVEWSSIVEFYKKDVSKLVFHHNAGESLAGRRLQGLDMKSIDENGNITFINTNDRNAAIGPVSMNNIIYVSTGGRRRRKSRKSLFKKKRTKKRKRRRKRNLKEKPQEEKKNAPAQKIINLLKYFKIIF